jgi:competence protein ComEC
MRKRLFELVIAFLMVFILDACSDEMPSNSQLPTITLSEKQEAQAIAETEEATISDIEDAALPDLMRDLAVHFLDVGQGDSIFIELPNGQNMLIDGGESSSAKAVQEYLLSKNVSTIDYLVATHPHEDHIGGLPAIIDAFDIESVYMPRVSHTTKTFEKLLTSIGNKGLQIDIAKADVNILTAPDLKIDIIAPVRDDYSDLNNHSAVVRIIYGDTGFLFMGDAEELSEGHITADVSVDVLKAGHHGSGTSTSQAFLDKAAPTYAVISVGSRNSYNHPAGETLKRLIDADIYVYRTDLQVSQLIRI